jgi:predicted transcriptional regulator
MSEEPRPPISDAEQEVLHALWDQGPGTVREMQQRLEKRGLAWSRSTVITLLQRLEKKGYAASDQSGYAFVFRAAVTREELGHQGVRELADKLYHGQAAPLLLAFAERQKLTREELDELRALIDQLARQSKNKRTK